MRILLALSFLAIAFVSLGQEEEIRKVLSDQEACWSNGDLECFMQAYEKSDELVFVGPAGPKYGWQVALNNYKKSYPNQEGMGTLTYEVLKLKPIGKKHYLVIGKWKLKRTSDVPQGHFSLLFEKIKGEWKIVADHSS